MERVARSLQAFGAAGVHHVVRSIVGDQATLECIAASSHFHGNGFYKIVLADEPEFRLRLHIWPAGLRSEENLHNHRWHLASAVLTGRLASEVWEDAISPDDLAYDEYLYFARDGEHGPHDLPVGKAHVRLRDTVVRSAGEAYALEPHVMHRIVGTSDVTTSTLACHAGATKRWARTISISGATPNSEQRFLAARELERVLVEYLATPEMARC
jgi:hypothetical protein